MSFSDTTLQLFGALVIKLKETESTNRFLTDFSETQVLPEGIAVVAEHQTSGRGQKGTEWISTPGNNILISYLIRPHFLAVKDQFLLSKAVALGVRNFIAEYVPASSKVQIKWPNDIYVNKRKIAGILIENSIQNQKIRQSVIGIGINVNETQFHAEFHATSIAIENKVQQNIQELISKLHVHLNQSYLLLQTGNIKRLDKNYSDHLYQRNQLCKYRFLDQEIIAEITGTDATGKLILKKEDETEIKADLKEIIFLREL